MTSYLMSYYTWSKCPTQGVAAALQVALYCDLHGHSRKHGAFMYGCQQAAASQVGTQPFTSMKDNYIMLPIIVHWACLHQEINAKTLI